MAWRRGRRLLQTEDSRSEPIVFSDGACRSRLVLVLRARESTGDGFEAMLPVRRIALLRILGRVGVAAGVSGTAATGASVHPGRHSVPGSGSARFGARVVAAATRAHNGARESRFIWKAVACCKFSEVRAISVRERFAWGAGGEPTRWCGTGRAWRYRGPFRQLLPACAMSGDQLVDCESPSCQRRTLPGGDRSLLHWSAWLEATADGGHPVTWRSRARKARGCSVGVMTFRLQPIHPATLGGARLISRLV